MTTGDSLGSGPVGLSGEVRDEVEDRFDLLVNAPALFNAVVTAVEIGLFAVLTEAPGTGAGRLAAAVRLPAHQTRVLLQALCSTGLVRRVGDGYHPSPFAARELVDAGRGSWRDILLGWRSVYYPAFPQLTTALRAGTNTALADYPGDEPTLYARLSRAPEQEGLFHRAMTAFSARSLPDLVLHAPLDVHEHLLDVGGGAGATTAALLHRHPRLASTVLDLPSVSGLARRSIQERFGDRVRFHGADLFTDDFPEGPDAVLFSHVLEIFAEDRIEVLLRKAHRVLPPGGRVLIYGHTVSDDETQGLYSARLSLYLNVLASGQGMAYPAVDYENWLRRAGFHDVRTVRGLAYEHSLTTAVKP